MKENKKKIDKSKPRRSLRRTRVSLDIPAVIELGSTSKCEESVNGTENTDNKQMEISKLKMMTMLCYFISVFSLRGLSN